ncbi:MAG: SGNH/GDSL hydrolase family protein [Lentisphaeria bacterium]
MLHTQWSGKKIAFLGDSITDKNHIGTSQNYWQILEEQLGIIPFVYAVNGHNWSHIPSQINELETEIGNNLDAIFIFMGTNDYNSSRPLGKWWILKEEEVNNNGTIKKKMRRSPDMDPTTFRGLINFNMAYLKEHFPLQQIVLLTPIHRGFACFSETNIQPEESYPNDIGLYLDSYITVIRETSSIWAVPVIDLYCLSGLFPITDSHGLFFHDAANDRLHPNVNGHKRIAQTILYQMLTLPASFR